MRAVVGLVDRVAPTAGYVHPLLWVSSSYFAMGTVYVTVTTASNIMFKNLGLSNQAAAFYASALGLPYVLKPAWAPLLEIFRTKRFFVVAMQLGLAAAFVGVALALALPAWRAPALVVLAVAAFAGATMDVGTDGVYVTTLDSRDQARFSGFQSLCWGLGPIVATGALVAASGALSASLGWARAWSIVFLVLAGLVGALAFYHLRILPPGSRAAGAAAGPILGRAFTSFFAKKGFGAMIAFAFFYRFALGLLDKVEPLFLIDARGNGGLGLSNAALGHIVGTLGTVAFMAGSLLGGFVVASLGLRRVLFALCLCLNAPVLIVLYLGHAQPSSLELIGAAVFLERLCWGIGAVGHMIYMMQQIAPGPYRTAHYAFATGLMGLCFLVTGIASGTLQQAVGYPTFFVIAACSTIPSLVATARAPFLHGASEAQPELR